MTDRRDEYLPELRTEPVFVCKDGSRLRRHASVIMRGCFDTKTHRGLSREGQMKQRW